MLQLRFCLSIFSQTVVNHADFGRISSYMYLILTNNEIPYFSSLPNRKLGTQQIVLGMLCGWKFHS